MGVSEFDLAVARRLRALQQAVGGGVPTPHDQMADFANCTAGSWQNYQSGKRDFPPKNAEKLKARFGVTLDWIYTGDASRNPKDLQAKIDLALRNPVPPKRGKRNR
jgi:hypothetical protein